MHHKQISDNPKTLALIMDTGGEIVDTLKQFASSQKLAGTSFEAIGALSYVKLGCFNWETKEYDVAAELHEQVELLSMIGDIALEDGKPQVHAHLVVGQRNGTAKGGHLLKALVRPTCELILTENPASLQKQFDPESGLALIRL